MNKILLRSACTIAVISALSVGSPVLAADAKALPSKEEMWAMIQTQQKQIEELFLYIIEMNKKIKRLEQENKALKKQSSDSN